MKSMSAVLAACFYLLVAAIPTASAIPWQRAATKIPADVSLARAQADSFYSRYPSHRMAYLTIYYANSTDLPHDLLAALVDHESQWDSLATNPADPSYGLGAVMPKYWSNSFVETCGVRATPTSLQDAEVGMCYTANILSRKIRQYGFPAGLDAYNNGIGRSDGFAQQVISKRRRYSQ